MRNSGHWLLVGLFLVGCESETAKNTNAPPAKDNTAVNERDQQMETKTPLDQTEDSASVKITAAIRQKIVNQQGMSINARNAKIITEKGHVTLRGPVASQQEKDMIAKFAMDTAGETNVDNQLEIVAE